VALCEVRWGSVLQTAGRLSARAIIASLLRAAETPLQKRGEQIKGARQHREKATRARNPKTKG